VHVDHEADCELARKHRTSSAGHEATERADGPRSYPLIRVSLRPTPLRETRAEVSGNSSCTIGGGLNADRRRLAGHDRRGKVREFRSVGRLRGLTDWGAA